MQPEFLATYHTTINSKLLTTETTNLTNIFLIETLLNIQTVEKIMYTGYETLLNICRTSENKHHTGYNFRILQKNLLTRKLNKNFQASPKQLH